MDAHDDAHIKRNNENGRTTKIEISLIIVQRILHFTFIIHWWMRGRILIQTTLFIII